jgi:DNA invertase Pin-like site-specific DNA recombinase
VSAPRSDVELLGDLLALAHRRMDEHGYPPAPPRPRWQDPSKSHCKLSARDQQRLREMRANGAQRAELARRFHVSPSTVDRIVRSA